MSIFALFFDKTPVSRYNSATMIIHFDNVPFYSQFQDMPRVEWRQESCGIASMAMELGFFKAKSVPLTKLLLQALDLGAYTTEGWKHKELSALAGLYGLQGKNYDYASSTNEAAFSEFKNLLGAGPIIVSIHNKFNPRATLGHLVVVTGINEDTIFYHDPASSKTEKSVSTANFLKGWKKRFITVREKEVVLDAAIGNNS